MRAKRTSSQAGYTLVELLVVLVLAGLVIGALSSILVTTFLSANVATSRVEAAAQVRTFQLTAQDDIALSTVPAPSGCGTQADPCTSQPILLQGSRVPNVPSGGPSGYALTYTWNPVSGTITRQLTGGANRTVATNVTSFSWYVDSSTAHPVVVVHMVVTEDTYNSKYSQHTTLQFAPRVSGS